MTAPPIAFALDYASLDEARDAARDVAPAIGMVKVGLELFVRHGADAVALGTDVGLPVFLDLKLHDIPETVGRAVAQVAELGARVVTVHASGGRAMLRRAVESAKRAAPSRPLDVCAVTVLTSLDEGDLKDLDFGGGLPTGASRTGELACRLARLAWDEGVRWFVCSPLEVRRLREVLGPEAVLVTPGIRSVRPEDAEGHGDQKRVATPESAMRDGASWLVIGRPIRDAANKLEAARAIGRAIAGVYAVPTNAAPTNAVKEKER